jgi:hypothetical protein
MKSIYYELCSIQERQQHYDGGVMEVIITSDNLTTTTKIEQEQRERERERESEICARIVIIIRY